MNPPFSIEPLTEVIDDSDEETKEEVKPPYPLETDLEEVKIQKIIDFLKKRYFSISSNGGWRTSELTGRVTDYGPDRIKIQCTFNVHNTMLGNDLIKLELTISLNTFKLIEFKDYFDRFSEHPLSDEMKQNINLLIPFMIL
jgi:hypothetical protein